MNIIIYNSSWISFNLFLSFIPVLCAFLMLKAGNSILRLFLFILFLLFVPNTLYVITDIIHFTSQYNKLQTIELFILIFQYVVLLSIGLSNFILSINMIEKYMNRLKVSNYIIIVTIIMLNSAIGIGIVLGRVMRINSWEVFTDIGNVTYGFYEVITSYDLILSAVLFGLIGNLFYYLARNHTINLLIRIYRPFKYITHS